MKRLRLQSSYIPILLGHDRVFTFFQSLNYSIQDRRWTGSRIRTMNEIQDDGNLIFLYIKLFNHFMFQGHKAWHKKRNLFRNLLRRLFKSIFFSYFSVPDFSQQKISFFTSHTKRKFHCCTMPGERCNNIDFAD